ncbi:hypothetical protein FNW25_13390 [Flavobacterium franklandianum]|uniref:DUF4890 domain-containing protein n=1 Tax=Flavobacterium franklandianum TaxID=2594430 RepID=A0A553C6C4_9FLAO|nr:hypothetical protein [Flavobacterium franklandianum]TRX16079.1 hypothetical protein FNW17_14910 [Flavobacterium franklandianum]TRX23390.1 hypothetical protein FNW25_13390 [Flavobacterium franklandianum]
MKTTTLFITCLIILISINTISAQYGNNGYGGNGYGNGSRNGMNQMGGMNQRSEPEKPKEIPAEEIVAKYMEDMKPAVGLDELQSIAITNVLVESVNAQGRITKLNLSQEDLMNEYKALAESTDRKINNFLNKDQKDKYLAFKEDIKQPKKKKDKKKGQAPENKEK